MSFLKWKIKHIYKVGRWVVKAKAGNNSFSKVVKKNRDGLEIYFLFACMCDF